MAFPSAEQVKKAAKKGTLLFFVLLVGGIGARFFSGIPPTSRLRHEPFAFRLHQHPAAPAAGSPKFKKTLASFASSR
jgi:hypothetical protein